MDKIILSRENYDSILDTNRPNCSSRSWYLEETGYFSYPKTIAPWSFYDEDTNRLKDYSSMKLIVKQFQLVEDFFEYIDACKLKNECHVYYIPLTNAAFFVDNLKIGFSCIDNKIKNDIRIGKCKILLYMMDDGVTGSEKNKDLEIIEKWRIKEKFPEYSIHYLCLNLDIERVLDKKNLKFYCHSTHWNSETYLITSPTLKCNIPDKKSYKLFLNYNRNPHLHRYLCFLHLIETGLLNQGLVSFTKFENKDLIYSVLPFFSEETINYGNSILPLKIKNFDNSIDDVFLGQNMDIDDFDKTFISVVSESSVLKDSIYLSEKTFKPISLGHPFLLIASKGSLEKLKENGYKTFNKWWDESYDECDSFTERIDKIIQILIKLNKMNYDSLVDMRKDMESVLEYNRAHFYKRIAQENPLHTTLRNIYNNLIQNNQDE